MHGQQNIKKKNILSGRKRRWQWDTNTKNQIWIEAVSVSEAF